jgi:hypothetical protein
MPLLAFGITRLWISPSDLSPPALFLFAMLWAALLVQAFLGWGLLVTRGIPWAREHPGIAAPTGLAVFVILGGWANLFGLVSTGLLTGFVVVGALACVFIARPAARPRQQPDTLARVLTVLAVLAVLWRLLLAASWTNFNEHDDLQGYFVFPTKMVALGSLGEDPFSERRTISGWGGQYLLLATVLAQLPHRFLHLIDPGVAIACAALIIVRGAGRGTSLSVRALLLLAMALFPAPLANVTAAWIAVPLMLALASLLTRQVDNATAGHAIDWRLSVLMSAVVAGLCSLKNSLIPYAAIFVGLGFAYLLVLTRGRRLQTAAHACVVLAGTMFFVLPWAWDLLRSSGTLLYPLAGRGFYVTAYAPSIQDSPRFMDTLRHVFGAAVISNSLGPLCGLMLVALLATRVPPRASRIIGILALTAAFTSFVAVGLAAHGYAPYRYGFSALIGSLIIGVLDLAEFPPTSRAGLCAAVVAVFLVGFGWAHAEITVLEDVRQIRAALRGDTVETDVRRRAYQAIATALPADGALLARVDLPYLLPFRRDIYIADWPGAASPPPGMPLNAGAEALASYLRGSGIRYLLWDYGSRAHFSHEDWDSRLRADENSWIRANARLAFDFQDNADVLMRTYTTSYNRDGLVLIDLQRPAP